VCAAVQCLYALSYLQFRWGILALQAGALDRAQSCLAEALRYGDEVDSAREMGVAMDALGWVAAGKKEMERAAGLFGAAQVLLERAGYNLPPCMATAHERAVAVTQSALSTRFQVALSAPPMSHVSSAFEATCSVSVATCCKSSSKELLPFVGGILPPR